MYCVTQKELVAIMKAIHLFRQAFTVRTDHAALQWLLKFRNPEGQLYSLLDSEVANIDLERTTLI